MHIEDLLIRAFAQHKTRFVFVVGYDEPDCSFADVQTYGSDRVPDDAYMDFVTTFYKPLQIKGAARGMIWVDAYDEHGKLNLPDVVRTGEVSYSK